MVASLARIAHSRPSTRPIPAMRPAPWMLSSYIPLAASGDSSRNGVPGSIRRSTRSRGKRLPRAAWRSRARAEPPSAASARRRFKSSTSARIAAALARNSTLAVSAGESRIAMSPPLREGCPGAAVNAMLPRRRQCCVRGGRNRAKLQSQNDRRPGTHVLFHCRPEPALGTGVDPARGRNKGGRQGGLNEQEQVIDGGGRRRADRRNRRRLCPTRASRRRGKRQARGFKRNEARRVSAAQKRAGAQERGEQAAIRPKPDNGAGTTLERRQQPARRAQGR